MVAITSDEFCAKLSGVAASRRWRLARARSIEEAEMLIVRKPTPLVIYEGDAGNGNWRFMPGDLYDLPPHWLRAARVGNDAE
jgi:hypothetical protein